MFFYKIIIECTFRNPEYAGMGLGAREVLVMGETKFSGSGADSKKSAVTTMCTEEWQFMPAFLPMIRVRHLRMSCRKITMKIM